jgi:hypothetical protein
VVDNSYDNEEKNECAEKKIPKNTAQHELRASRKTQYVEEK